MEAEYGEEGSEHLPLGGFAVFEDFDLSDVLNDFHFFPNLKVGPDLVGHKLVDLTLQLGFGFSGRTNRGAGAGF